MVVNALNGNQGELRVPLEEDRLSMKLLSCIPIVGISFAQKMQEEIASNIKFKYNELPLAIRAINLKNQYKVANVVDLLLTGAILTTLVALKILALSSLAPEAVFCCLLLAISEICEIYSNKETIRDLKAGRVQIDDLELV